MINEEARGAPARSHEDGGFGERLRGVEGKIIVEAEKYLLPHLGGRGRHARQLSLAAPTLHNDDMVDRNEKSALYRLVQNLADNAVRHPCEAHLLQLFAHGKRQASVSFVFKSDILHFKNGWDKGYVLCRKFTTPGGKNPCPPMFINVKSKILHAVGLFHSATSPAHCIVGGCTGVQPYISCRKVGRGFDFSCAAGVKNQSFCVTLRPV